MSPRTYHLGQRQEAIAATRRRIIDAARELLTAPGGVGAFTVEAVARRAGVARMTVYYQYGSKAGLLEAIYDDLAQRGLVDNLPAVFHEATPRQALDQMILAFCRFWASDRLLIRRLRGLALVDPEVEAGIRRRDEWRRLHCDNLLQRLQQGGDTAALARLLAMLTSFEAYDALAAPDDPPERVAAIVQRLASASLAAGAETRPSRDPATPE